ncbi:hypothetical protein KC356_g49 [Hortaea werneckii]|nr:hypothetical protein KC356_g49 [Hortaea werneckii]
MVQLKNAVRYSSLDEGASGGVRQLDFPISVVAQRPLRRPETHSATLKQAYDDNNETYTIQTLMSWEREH